MAKIPSTISFIEDGDCMTLTITRASQGTKVDEVVFSFTTIGIAKGPDGFIVKVGDRDLGANTEHEF